ncbi:hypothetical protein [Carnobacterium maltaromaticum]|uniref:hypothetical protein n=1 Tax=Carnobacterium maltaromaticum TaxID=2751 RepID=UPI001D5E3C11|nr:hypothetical protein [Carnobacterium maltaromaticum]MCC4312137.1 hypothetical protein [Carnobacterium maltaromaticum]
MQYFSMSNAMRGMGFMVLSKKTEQCFLLDYGKNLSLVVESMKRDNPKDTSKIKYEFYKLQMNKKQSHILKIYCTEVTAIACVTKVARHLLFMMNKGYLEGSQKIYDEALKYRDLKR